MHNLKKGKDKGVLRRTSEETEVTRNEIVTAAIRIFAERGYHNTNMQEIADATGLSRGPLYYHFKNKAALLHEAVKTHIAAETRHYRDIFRQDKHILQLIREDLLYCTRDIRANTPGLFRIPSDDPCLKSIHTMIYNMENALYKLKEASVRRAIEKGELRVGTQPRHIVNIMFILYEGLCTTTQMSKIISSIKDIDNAIEFFLAFIEKEYCTNP
ncbi:MAG: TetR/AcrR family transcriptional regulator [Spirochaetia bacterium]|jgi:AcrR family transcriptional regulator|nr:TetR/AcrR family transcriptional regulator [Spirochaetia bacterium]